MTFFFESAILIFQKKNMFFFYFFPNEKQLGGSYEESFIPALWMVFSESRKRLHSIYYAHDCILYGKD